MKHQQTHTHIQNKPTLLWTKILYEASHFFLSKIFTPQRSPFWQFTSCTYLMLLEESSDIFTQKLNATTHFNFVNLILSIVRRKHFSKKKNPIVEIECIGRHRSNVWRRGKSSTQKWENASPKRNQTRDRFICRQCSYHLATGARCNPSKKQTLYHFHALDNTLQKKRLTSCTY